MSNITFKFGDRLDLYLEKRKKTYYEYVELSIGKIKFDISQKQLWRFWQAHKAESWGL